MMRVTSAAQANPVQVWTTSSDEAGVGAGLEVPNGSYRINSTDNPEILNVAFRDTNGRLVLIAYNNTTTAQTFKVLSRPESFHYTLPINTTATFRWSGNDQ